MFRLARGLLVRTVLGLVGVLAPVATFALESKVASIDMQRAVQSSAAGQKAKKELDAEFAKRKANLDKKKSEIEKVGQELEKKRSVLSEEVLAKRQGELQQSVMQFQKLVSDSQNDMQKMQSDLLSPILEKIKKVVEKVAGEKGFTIVLEKSERNVVFAHKDFDITDEVLKAFEAQSK